jgi:HD-like signal output (HDOD) protein
LRKQWNRIVYVGAVAAVLARRSGRFSPEQGILAGLISNVGVLSVFNYLANYPEIGQDEARTNATVDELKADVGAMVLERWGFSEDLIACARSCEAWQYQHDSSEEADLCDLVIAASYHANIGRLPLPGVEAVPACHRLLGPDLNPEAAVEFLRDAQQEINEARALIG